MQKGAIEGYLTRKGSKAPTQKLSAQLIPAQDKCQQTKNNPETKDQLPAATKDVAE
jgi:hypothetical protein